MEPNIENIQDKVEQCKCAVGQAVNKVKNEVKDLAANNEGVSPRESGEGFLTKKIENLTSKIPSGTFLSLAAGAIGISALLRLANRKEDAQFVGHWVPTILVLGLYNKLVKLEGSE